MTAAPQWLAGFHLGQFVPAGQSRDSEDLKVRGLVG
jgi:hypothetical protein